MCKTCTTYYLCIAAKVYDGIHYLIITGGGNRGVSWTWDIAQHECRRWGGQLTSIVSDDENHFLMRAITDPSITYGQQCKWNEFSSNKSMF